MVHNRHKKKVGKKEDKKKLRKVSREETESSTDNTTTKSVSSVSVTTSVTSETTDSSSNDYSEQSDSPKRVEVRRPEVVIKPKKVEQVFTISSKHSRSVTNNDIYKELISKQLRNVPDEWRLGDSDMKRICKYIDTSIFDETQCCFWKGYITNANSSNKGTYVNFYFKHKKVALHRLLYSNFVAPLSSNEYLKFNCENKGICCNVCHYRKYKYSKNMQVPRKNPPKEVKKTPANVVTIGGDSDDLILDFD